MLREFRFMVCAAVVGFAGSLSAVSVASAGEPGGACNGGPANIKQAPPPGIRYRWVAVRENGQIRYVKKAYRVGGAGPAILSAKASTTSGFGIPIPTASAAAAPAPDDLPLLASEPPGAAIKGGEAAGSIAPNLKSANHAVLANRAQALLKAKCIRCHGQAKQEAGLDLRSRETILKGGESGPGLIPGQPGESLVLKRVRDGEMPPGNVLSPREVATLQQWIAAGAPSGRAQSP